MSWLGDLESPREALWGTSHGIGGVLEPLCPMLRGHRRASVLQEGGESVGGRHLQALERTAGQGERAEVVEIAPR